MSPTHARPVRTMLAGLSLAVFAALVVGLGQLLGLDLEHVALLGSALGGVVGLVPDRSRAGRVAAFLVGFAVAWAGFAVRAAVLPDSAGGRAVAAFAVVGVCLVVSAATLTRLPLWAMLVGVAALVGAYEQLYTAAPSDFLSQSPTAATTVLLAAALGYLATTLLGPTVEASRAGERRRGRVDGGGGHADTPSEPDRAAAVGAPASHRADDVHRSGAPLLADRTL